jgi:hypothetical protein
MIVAFTVSIFVSRSSGPDLGAELLDQLLFPPLDAIAHLAPSGRMRVLPAGEPTFRSGRRQSSAPWGFDGGRQSRPMRTQRPARILRG